MKKDSICMITIDVVVGGKSPVTKLGGQGAEDGRRKEKDWVHKDSMCEQ